MPPEKRPDFWDDGIHFTAHGYDVIGQALGKRLVELRDILGTSLKTETDDTEMYKLEKAESEWDLKSEEFQKLDSFR
jgi:hypothetical protein